MSKKVFDATCKVSACVCSSLPQNATNLLNLHLCTAAVWLIISVTQILKQNWILWTIPLKGCIAEKLNSSQLVTMSGFTLVERWILSVTSTDLHKFHGTLLIHYVSCCLGKWSDEWMLKRICQKCKLVKICSCDSGSDFFSYLVDGNVIYCPPRGKEVGCYVMYALCYGASIHIVMLMSFSTLPLFYVFFFIN